jgi:hypothetical protein
MVMPEGWIGKVAALRIPEPRARRRSSTNHHLPRAVKIPETGWAMGAVQAHLELGA